MTRLQPWTKRPATLFPYSTFFRPPFRAVFTDGRAALGLRLPILTVSMLVASLLEGAGLTMLMPLLGRIGLGDAASANVPILRIIDPLLLALGVPYEIGSLKIGRASCRERVCQYV